MALQPFPRPLDEQSLHNRDIQIGFDGSLLSDGAEVYVLGGGGVRRVEYFHHLVDGVAMCMMEDVHVPMFLEVVSATEMINISKGFTALRITNLQRRWRFAKARRYEKSMIAFGIAVARIRQRQREKATQIKICPDRT